MEWYKQKYTGKEIHFHRCVTKIRCACDKVEKSQQTKTKNSLATTEKNNKHLTMFPAANEQGGQNAQLE